VPAGKVMSAKFFNAAIVLIIGQHFQQQGDYQPGHRYRCGSFTDVLFQTQFIIRVLGVCESEESCKWTASHIHQGDLHSSGPGDLAE
jgi:hypothetical protein